jgi:hypothetical protein
MASQLVTLASTGFSGACWRVKRADDVACILLTQFGVVKEAQPMRQRTIEPVSTRLLKVGLEVFPVYGDERLGWSMDPVDLTPDTPKWLRYDSLDELFFALLNLNVMPEGQA